MHILTLRPLPIDSSWLSYNFSYYSANFYMYVYQFLTLHVIQNPVTIIHLIFLNILT